MSHLIGYVLLIYFGNQDVMVVLTTFTVALTLVMILIEAWKYLKPRGGYR